MTFARHNPLILILTVAAILRLFLLWENMQAHPAYFHNNVAQLQQQISLTERPYHNSFGSEISNIAYALVSGQGFSSPFGGKTGPTGWIAPGMVAVYAAGFYLFGPFSFGAVLSMFLLSLLVSLITIRLVYAVAMQVFNHRSSALAGALLYALSPHDLSLFYKPNQQDFNFFPFMFILNLFFFLNFYKDRSPGRLLCFSLTAAITALFNPVFLAPLAACLLFFAFCTRKKRLRAFSQAGMCFLIILIILGSYSLYQKKRLGAWTLIKSNGMYELYQGNIPEFDGVLTESLFHKHHPIFNIKEYQNYRTLGEIDYIASKRRIFLNQFDLLTFLNLCTKRFVSFYFVFPSFQQASILQNLLYASRGSALALFLMLRFRRMNYLEMLVVSYILVFSLPYCAVGIMYRYSFPIVPLTMMLLGRSLFLLFEKIKKKTRSL